MWKMEKMAGFSVGDNFAGFEQDDARGEEQSFANVVSDEDDGFFQAASERGEFALQLSAGDGIESGEGFVHQENGGIGGEGASHADALALTTGKLARMACGEFRGIEADKMEQFLDTSRDFCGRPIFEGGHKSDIFRDSEMGKESGVLNDIADLAAQSNGIPRGSGAALDQDLALGRN